MDIMVKIVIVALSIIIVVALGVGFFNAFYDNSSYDIGAECQEMKRNLFKHELAFNQSAAHYRYRADALEGQLDLPGDLAAWRNHLVNEYNKLQHETNNLEDMCSTNAS